MRKLVVSLVLWATLALCNIGFGADGVMPGAGTSTNPYLIEDYADFQAFCADTSKWASGIYTRLDCDLDLNPGLGRVTYRQAPIAGDTSSTYGFQGTKFTGNFDGNGHIIKNLRVSSRDFCGLFGKIGSDGEVTNLGLEDMEVSGVDHIGGLCGMNDGNISSSYATGTVTGDSHVGGLCGENMSGTISSSYATGTVNGSNSVGGLCGMNDGNISSSYASGAVTGSHDVGGLCGENYGNISSSYWNTDTSSLAISAGGWGLSDEQMKQAASYYGWTDGSWKIDEGRDYPRLVWENTTGEVINTDYPPATYAGAGTQQSPYQLGTVADLLCLMYRDIDWDKSFVLTADIDLGGLVFNHSFIGYGSNFSGRLDGAGHIVSNFTIYAPNQSNVGFISRINSGAEITDLGLENMDITGNYSVGGLCGANGGTISSCYASSAVTGDDSVGGLCGANGGNISSCHACGAVTGSHVVGGLCGVNWSGTISSSYASGEVAGDFGVGGLCGDNGGTISSCYACGAVTGDNSVGGLCGMNGGNISSCYASGAVTGDGSVGGLCGANYDNISSCYASGAVTGDSSVGGLCGYQYYSSAMIENCFWDTQSSGQTVGYNLGSTPSTITNVQGLTTAQMQIQSTFTDAGWDFVGETANGTDYIWQMSSGDYPCLAWQEIEPIVDLTLISGKSGQVDIFFNVPSGTFGWYISYTSCPYITSVSPSYGFGTTGDLSATVTISSAGMSKGLNICELTVALSDGSTIEKTLAIELKTLPVGLTELELLAQYWLTSGCGEGMPCSEVDYYNDGIIDMADFAKLAASWLAKEVSEEMLLSLDGFESGDLLRLNWQSSGDAAWYVTGDNAGHGSYSARSGVIDDDQTSSLSVTLDCTGYTEIRFSRMVSSESCLDYLKFYIDGVRKSSWSGELGWSEFSYPVSSGEHTFRWAYIKDDSINEGNDAAWIDNIRLQ